MRIERSNNTKSATNLKTRRCVVRVKRMKTTQSNKNQKRAAPARAEPTSSTSSRRTAAATPAKATLSTSLKAKDRARTPIVNKNAKTDLQNKKIAITDDIVEELPPTIAAGRSRRAHKPNPKYINEDLLTPRSLLKASHDDDREVPRSAKGQRTSAAQQHHIESDSDFIEDAEDSDGSMFERTTRSRPPKLVNDNNVRRAAVNASASASTSNLNKTAPTAQKNIPTPKTAPTQLQQLRRTLNASNVSPLSLGKKRKLFDSPNTSMEAVAVKRSNISLSTPRSAEGSSTPGGMMKRRQSPSVAAVSGETGNSAKPTLSQPSAVRREAQDKKNSSIVALTRSSSVASLKTLISNKPKQNSLQRSVALSNSTPSLNKVNLSRTSAASTSNVSKVSSATSLTSIAATNRAKNVAGKQQQLSSSASTSPVLNKSATESQSSDADDKATITIDDFETMPTFTIVNINDIINKKGDVLISAKSEQSRNASKQQTQTAQTPQNKPLSKKLSPEANTKTSQPLSSSTPFGKKPTEKSANTTLNKIINRNSTGASKISSPVGKIAATKPATRSGVNASEKKAAPRILNSIVSTRTKPVKPVIANLDISDDDPSGSVVSLCTDEEEDNAADEEEEDYDPEADELSLSRNDSELSADSSESMDSPKRRLTPKRATNAKPLTGRNKQSKVSTTPPNAAKENSAAAVNNILPKTKATPTQASTKTPSPLVMNRKLSPEKVVVQREGNKIIKKITCFETWYVINIPSDTPEEHERNALELPLVDLANAAKSIELPTDTWTTKVSLYELKKPLNKSQNLTLYNGDLTEQNIKESDRANYQPSCVMFRRTVPDRTKLQLPYDRAVIFKNKTFFTNIEGKNVKLVGAPTTIKELSEVETLLNIVDGLTLQSSFVEPATTIL